MQRLAPNFKKQEKKKFIIRNKNIKCLQYVGATFIIEQHTKMNSNSAIEVYINYGIME